LDRSGIVNFDLRKSINNFDEQESKYKLMNTRNNQSGFSSSLLKEAEQKSTNNILSSILSPGRVLPPKTPDHGSVSATVSPRT
jgi:hypothetical protein